MYNEIVPHSISAEELAAKDPVGVIFSGGPKSVHVEGAPGIDPAVYELGIPVLGICYGAQLVARDLGGEVARTGRGEYGRTEIKISSPGVLFGTTQPLQQQVWMSHFDSIAVAPEEFEVTASAPDAPVAAMENVERRIHAVQFHTPRWSTPRTARPCSSTSSTTCAAASPTWTMGSVIEQQVAAIREQVGGARVICALSGGGRLRGGRRAGAQGHRPAAHLRVRGHRAHAAQRGRAGGGDV